MDLILSSAIFAVVVTVVLILLSTRGAHGDKTAELLEQIKRADEGENADALLRRNPRRRQSGHAPFFQALYNLNLSKRLEESMWQAGIYTGVSEMMLIILLLFGAGMGIGAMISGDSLLSAGTGAGLAVMPLLFIRFKRQRRLKAFRMQLPSALDLMKSSLEAGHSLVRGLQVLVKEFDDPLGGEFRTVLEQTRLGVTLGRALDDLLKRVPEDDLRLLVVAVKIQSEVGSSLAQIIGRLSEIVRTRQRLAAQIHAMTAQSRMSGMVVGLLPVLVLAGFSMVQPSYAEILFYDPTGLKVLKAAIGLDVMAFIVIRRILKVNY
ncbi:MAG: type II secretion system F family protein [Candidatus Binataceae bacterium]|jgi:tight adherence protein B